MPIVLPSLLFRRARIRPINVVGASASPWTLQEQVFKHQGQAWSFGVSYPVKERADAEPILGALLSLNGRAGTFLLGDPLGKTPRGTLAVEPASANGVPNNTMVGASLGVLGSGGALPSNWGPGFDNSGATVEVTSTGATGEGIEWINIRFSAPTSVGTYILEFVARGVVTAAALQTWHTTAFVKRTAGSESDITFSMAVLEADAAGGFLTSSNTPFVPGIDLLVDSRRAHTRLLSDGATAHVYGAMIVSFGVTTTPDVTLTIGLPQLERAVAPTAPIKTIDAGAVTRPAGPVVFGAGQSGQVLNSWGWPSFGTASLLAGDYIQLGSGETQRLYKLTADIAADVEGKASLPIWPRLRESPADEEVIVTQDCQGVFSLAEDFFWEETVGGLYQPISFTAIEALRGS